MRDMEKLKLVDLYVNSPQCSRSLERTIDANQSATSQVKHRMIHIDTILFDTIALTRRLDDKALGHEQSVKVSLESFVGCWLSSSTFVTLMKVLDCCDQLPFGPHADAVWAVGVDDFESQRRRQFEVLHRKADGGGALADHADMRRRGEELEETRARILEVFKDQRQRIAVELRTSE
jgi:hypothetical protein